MRDNNGLFGRFQQNLYFARLHIEQVANIENAGTGDGISSDAGRFDTQRHRCFSEAAITSLYRGLCFLAGAMLDEPASSSLLRAPRELGDILGQAVDEQPSSAINLMLQTLRSHPANQGEGGDMNLAQLPLEYQQLWNPSARRSPDQIAVDRQSYGAGQLRAWLGQLTALGEQLVALETES